MCYSSRQIKNDSKGRDAKSGTEVRGFIESGLEADRASAVNPEADEATVAGPEAGAVDPASGASSHRELLPVLKT